MSFINLMKVLFMSIAVVVLMACSNDSGSVSFNPDAQPDDYNLTVKTNVAFSSVIESNIITLSGINMPVALNVSSGSYYRINGGIYTDDTGIVSNGNTVQVAHISSTNTNASVLTTLTISDINGTFKSTTPLIKDTEPDAFSFTDQTSIAIYRIVESDSIIVSGINAPTTISISDGSYYRINGGIYTDDTGTVSNGNTVQVRHISSTDWNTSVSTTLTIGDGNGTFQSTRAAEDTILIDTFDVKLDFNATGDGIADDTKAIDDAILTARAAGRNVYFPIGTYLYDGWMLGQGVRLIGENKQDTIIKAPSYGNDHNFDGAENITFQDFKITDGEVSKSRIFRNCKFKIMLPVGTSHYLFYAGYYTEGANYEFTDCDFIFPDIYSALWIRKYNSVLIRNCTFNGYAWHNIRIAEPIHRHAPVSIIGNTITGGETGIFIGSSRVDVKEAGLIEGNTLINQEEESIGLDGFGNDLYEIPVIANGPITDVWNDENGRVVISMKKMVYNDGVNELAPSPISLRDDWNNFYFSFGEGSGLEGTIAKIQYFNSTNNTLTLDLITSSVYIQPGGDAGVQSGFFNWIIRGNTVTGTVGVPDTNYAGTAISVYINVFGTLVENNYVSNSSHAVKIMGGQMMTTYRTLAYSNVVRDNTFEDCDQNATGDPSESVGAVVFSSLWSASGPIQYNNKFINNTVNSGRIFIEQQVGQGLDYDSIYVDNNISDEVDLLILDPRL